MALGDGIRRDISQVSALERDRFIEAIRKLDTTKFFPDGVSYWDKQEEIHKNAHFNGVDVHVGPAFIPWHRVIVNRLEALLREVDPALSLHYWDWTTDPRVASGPRAALFTDQFMDNASGNVSHLLTNFESSEDAEIGNGHTKIWRAVGSSQANPDGTPNIAGDASMLGNGDFATFAAALKSAHDSVAHSYIGGTISNPHYSFHDPFVFLLHSNLDRIWAKWQTDPAHPERIAPATAYSGLNGGQLSALITEHVEPWAGGTGLEPWASDPTKRAVINYLDLSVVSPPCYDTNGSDFRVVEAENPFRAVELVLGAVDHRPRRQSGPAGLTPREVEVLVLIATGASAKQVAYALGITPKTAKTHIERIYTKCDVSSRSDATRFAIAHGLVNWLGATGR